MVDSILTTTKNALGLADDYEPYDPELIMHINSVMAILNQLGVGPSDGYVITDKTQTWSELLTNEGYAVEEKRLADVKSYVYMKVKMLFDPPSVGYVVTAWEKMIEEAEWRITVAQDDILHPASISGDVVISVDPDTERIIFDGGAP